MEDGPARVRRLTLTPLGELQAFAGEERAAKQADDPPLIKALGLAHHWQRLLDEGRSAGLRETAKAEGMDLGRVSKVNRLAHLAPSLIEAALNQGRLQSGLSELLGWFPDSWDVQRELLAKKTPEWQGLWPKKTTRPRCDQVLHITLTAGRGLG